MIQILIYYCRIWGSNELSDSWESTQAGSRGGGARLKSRKSLSMIAAVIAAVGITPVVIFHVFIGSAPTASPQAALEQLASGGWVLIDLREPAEFDRGHLSGAVSWPLEDVLRWRPGGPSPLRLNANKLLLICGSGLLSAPAAVHLTQIGGMEAYSVRGGLAAWYAVKAGGANSAAMYHSLWDGAGRVKAFPFRRSTFIEQAAVCVSAFGVKPFYMLASIGAFLWLRRVKAPDMLALKAAMLAFFIGEAFCAANYLLFEEDSYLLEYLHMFGMVASFGFAVYALIEGLDRRVLHFTDRSSKCALWRLCGTCGKQGDWPCRLRQFFQFLLFAMSVVCIMPLLAETREVSYNTEIFGAFYNYTHQVLFQLYEIRFAPAEAMICFAIAFIGLTVRKEKFLPPAKLWVAAGGGFLGFSLLRQGLFALYAENLVWFVCWEELTELLYIAGVVCGLWVFRRTIFEEPLTPAVAKPR